MVLETGSLRSGCWHGQVLEIALFLACRGPSSCILTRYRDFSGISSYQIPVRSGSYSLDFIFTLVTPIKALSPNIFTLGVMALTCEFCGKQNSAYTLKSAYLHKNRENQRHLNLENSARLNVVSWVQNCVIIGSCLGRNNSGHRERPRLGGLK